MTTAVKRNKGIVRRTKMRVKRPSFTELLFCAIRRIKYAKNDSKVLRIFLGYLDKFLSNQRLISNIIIAKRVKKKENYGNREIII